MGPRYRRCRNTGATSGRRYYSPELGRWINRDPIGESGGENVYCFVGNGATDAIDVFGLTEEQPTCNCCCCPKELRIVNVKKAGNKRELGHTFDVKWVLEF